MVDDLTGQRPALGSLWRRKRDGIKVRVVGFQYWFVLIAREPGQKKTRHTGRKAKPNGPARGARDGKQWQVKVATFPKTYEPVE
jgi:hypothetical protein